MAFMQDRKTMRSRCLNLAEKWKRLAKDYRQQVREARAKNLPHAQMLSGATVLNSCAKELEWILENKKSAK